MHKTSLIQRTAAVGTFVFGLLQFAQPTFAAEKSTDTLTIPSAIEQESAIPSNDANLRFAPGGGGGYHPAPPPEYHPAPPPPPVYHPAPPPPVYHPAPPPPVYHPAPPPPVNHPAPPPPVNHPAPPPPVNHPAPPPPVNHPAPPPPVNHPAPPPPVNHPAPPVNHPLPPHPVPPVTGPTHPFPHPGNGAAKPTHPLPPGAHNGGIAPNAPIKHVSPPNVVNHNQPSHLSNPVTRGHIAESNRRQGDIRSRDPGAFKYVNQAGAHYRQQYRKVIAQRTNLYHGYYRNDHYRFFYSDWYRFGFFGGYFYPVRGCENIDAYFTYPMVYWLFNPDFDADYWNDYYGDWQADDGSGAPIASIPVNAFPFAGVFYPTDTLRDLGIEVSALDVQAQANFRAAMGLFAATLQQDIADQLGADFQLGQYDVVVDHYQNLQNQAIVVEGFVDQAGSHFAFKALLDLTNPNATQVFIPSAQNPGAADELDALNSLNARIQALGGDPYTADQEPQTLPPSPALDGGALLNDALNMPPVF